MTMIIKLEMSAEQETQLREGIARGDQADVEKLLAQMVAPTVEDLLRQPVPETSYDEFERLLDELAISDQDAPLLSDYAVSRQSMYEDETL